MIRMTWPQYRRAHCVVDGVEFVQLSRRQAEVLLILMLRHPCPVPYGDIIGMIWPNPDDEPEFSFNITAHVIGELRKRIGGHHIQTQPGVGLRLVQAEPTMRKAAPPFKRALNGTRKAA